MEDEGWEARMAERHRARAVVREAEEIARQDAEWEPIDFEGNESGDFWWGCSCGASGGSCPHWTVVWSWPPHGPA
jgi:hypothetical protein